MKKQLLKKASALKKELLRKISSCLTLKKVTMRKCEEMAFPKIKLSENIATYAGREIAIDTDTYSLGIIGNSLNT